MNCPVLSVTVSPGSFFGRSWFFFFFFVLFFFLVGPGLMGVSWLLTDPLATQVPSTLTWEIFKQGLGRNRPENPCSVQCADSACHSGSRHRGILLYFMIETEPCNHVGNCLRLDEHGL